MDFTAPDVRFTYNLHDNRLFKKDNQNYIDAVGIKQLNTIGNVYLLDVFLSKGNLVEPHYHQNASELIYCVSGAALASLINPFTEELTNIPIKPGEVASIPQGWWHYVKATTDNTHLLAIHDTPQLQTIYGSDILRLTPPQVLAHTYCLDEDKVKDTLRPIKETVIIGPSNDCHKSNRPTEQHQTRGQNYDMSPYVNTNQQ